MKNYYDLYRIKSILKKFKDAKTWKLFLDENEKNFILLPRNKCELSLSVSLYTNNQTICISYSNLILNRKEKNNIRYLPLSYLLDDVIGVYRLTIKVPSKKIPSKIQPESCKLFLENLFVGNLKKIAKYEHNYIVSIIEFVNINKKIYF